MSGYLPIDIVPGLQLLVCRECGSVIADAVTHNKVDCSRPINPETAVRVIR